VTRFVHQRSRSVLYELRNEPHVLRHLHVYRIFENGVLGARGEEGWVLSPHFISPDML